MLPQPQNITLEQPMNTRLSPPYIMQRNLVSTAQEVGWAPRPVWTHAENLVPTPRLKPQTIQPVATPFTHNLKSYSGRSGLAPQEPEH